MKTFTRMLLVSALLLLPALSLRAQTAVDPSGHWEGLIHAGAMEVIIEVDVARNAKGEIAGTFSNANVRGFPLSNVVVDGTSITFEIKTTGGGAFHGSLGADGKSMKGTFTTHGADSHPVELPFELTRTGTARIEAASKSSAISKDLEGRWTGTLDVNGTPRQVGLNLVNHPDATATGFVISGDGVEIPITLIVQKGPSLTLDVKSVGGSYVGTLKGSGTELAGMWTQGPFVAPLTFRRAAANSVAPAAKNLVDRWASAAGGREKVATIKSMYREATIEVGGFKGSIKAWHTTDGKYRKEEQVGTFLSIETFDGKNGTLRQGDLPSHTMAGAELERAKSTAFANSNAMFFAFFPERRHGTLAIEGDNTIVLKPEGGIDWRVTLDAQTALPKTMIHKQGDRTITVTFVSYETVEGVRFEKEIHRSTGDPHFDSLIRFTKTVINPPVDALLFSIEPKKTPAANR
jgi:hypothetical protein